MKLRFLGSVLVAGGLIVNGCDCGGPIAGNDSGPDLRDGGVNADAGGSDAAAGDALGSDGSDGSGTDAALPGLFVDPVAGNDNGVCPQDQPCKTMARAFTVAASGQTVFLQAGTYSAASGETWDVQVPDGVAIEAVTAGQSIVVGPGPGMSGTAFFFAGSGTLRNLRVEQFHDAVKASEGNVLVETVEFVQNYLAVYAGRVGAVTLEDCIVRDGSSAFEINGIAKLTMNGGRISDSGPNCSGGAGIGTAWEAADIVFDGVEVSANYGSLSLRGVATAVVRNSVFDGNGSDGCGRSTQFDMGEAPTLTLENTIVRNGPGNGVMGTDTVRITGGSFTNNAANAVDFTGSSLNVSGTGFMHTDASSPHGIYIFDGQARIDGVTISGHGYGIAVSSGGYARVRGSTITENGTGVATWGAVDLGTAAEPGGNTILQNTQYNLHAEGPATYTVHASGDTWDPSLQGTDSQGHVTVGNTLAGPVSGDNFYLRGAEQTIQF